MMTVLLCVLFLAIGAILTAIFYKDVASEYLALREDITKALAHARLQASAGEHKVIDTIERNVRL